MDANNVIKTILSRRSQRSFESEQIKDDELFWIVEAGRSAPSGGNNQNCHFIVIQKEEMLEKLKETVRDEFALMSADESTYSSLRQSIERSKTGAYDFSYNAPTLIVIANKKSYPNAMADSCVAIENMIIAATSLGIGSCYINQLHWLSENEKVRSVLYGMSLKEDEIVCCSLALGYPLDAPVAKAPLHGNLVTYIK